MKGDEEAEFTLWSNGVAEVLDGKGRPELAALFRALARHDRDRIRETLEMYTLPVLEGLEDTLLEERAQRESQGEAKFAGMLDDVLAAVDEVREGRGWEEPGWDEEDTVH